MKLAAFSKINLEIKSNIILFNIFVLLNYDPRLKYYDKKTTQMNYKIDGNKRSVTALVTVYGGGGGFITP